MYAIVHTLFNAILYFILCLIEKVRWRPQTVTTDPIHPEPVHNNVSQIEPQPLSYVSSQQATVSKPSVVEIIGMIENEFILLLCICMLALLLT